jgi:hypothetical protein
MAIILTLACGALSIGLGVLVLRLVDKERINQGLAATLATTELDLRTTRKALALAESDLRTMRESLPKRFARSKQQIEAEYEWCRRQLEADRSRLQDEFASARDALARDAHRFRGQVASAQQHYKLFEQDAGPTLKLVEAAVELADDCLFRGADTTPHLRSLLVLCNQVKRKLVDLRRQIAAGVCPWKDLPQSASPASISAYYPENCGGAWWSEQP